jgi:hypothetical protein
MEKCRESEKEGVLESEIMIIHPAKQPTADGGMACEPMRSKKQTSLKTNEKEHLWTPNTL